MVLSAPVVVDRASLLPQLVDLCIRGARIVAVNVHAAIDFVVVPPSSDSAVASNQASFVPFNQVREVGIARLGVGDEIRIVRQMSDALIRSRIRTCTTEPLEQRLTII